MSGVGTALKHFFLGDIELDDLSVSEHKTAEELLAQSDTEIDRIEVVEDELAEVVAMISAERKKFQAIFDAMPQCVYVSDLVTREVYYVNPSMQRAALSDAGGVGKKCYEFLHGSSRPCEGCVIARIAGGEYPIHREIHNDRMGLDFKVVDTVIDWPGAGKAKLQIATDITEVKEAQRNLQRRTYELEALAESSYEAIAIHRYNRMIISNRAFQELTGYSAEELQDMDDLIGTLFPGNHEKIRAKVRDADRSIYKTIIRTKGGEDKEIIVKPNYVPFNHTGECRCAAIVTHEYMAERESAQ